MANPSVNIEQIKSILRTLPHAARINQNDLTQWLKTVAQQDPSRLLWHLTRARAVGGSEIGTLLLEAQGLTPPFGRSSTLLAKEKLLQTPPSRPLPHMLRGILLENAIRSAILNIYGGTEDYAAKAALANLSEPLNGTLVGNPDFYWMLGNQRILTDIKAPIQATELEGMQHDDFKLFSYQAQVQQYDMIGESLGIQADKLMLAELDVPVELADAWTSMIRKGGKGGYQAVVDQMTSLLAQEKPGMQIKFIEIPRHINLSIYGKAMEMREAITTVAGDFMHQLVTGERIDYEVEHAFLPASDAALERCSMLDQRLGQLRAMAEYIEGKIGEAQAEYQQLLGTERVNPADLNNTLFSVSSKSAFDLPGSIKQLDELAIDTSALRQEPPSEPVMRDLDPAKTIETLQSLGALSACLKPPAYDLQKVKDAMIDAGLTPVERTEYALRKGTSKAAKERFGLLAEHAVGVEHFLEMRMAQPAFEHEPAPAFDPQEETDPTPRPAYPGM